MDICHPFIYVLILLVLPPVFPTLIDMIIGATIGIIADSFYNTPGVHLAACVFIMFIRRYLIQDNPIQVERISERISSDNIGRHRFRKYVLLSVILHHFPIFFMNMGSFYHTYKVALQILFSCLFTISFILFYDFNVTKYAKNKF